MTADEMYIERLNQIGEQIVNIQSLLASHIAKQSRDTTNWGYVGDLGGISEQLAEIEEMLK